MTLIRIQDYHFHRKLTLFVQTRSWIQTELEKQNQQQHGVYREIQNVTSYDSQIATFLSLGKNCSLVQDVILVSHLSEFFFSKDQDFVLDSDSCYGLCNDHDNFLDCGKHSGSSFGIQMHKNSNSNILYFYKDRRPYTN